VYRVSDWAAGRPASALTTIRNGNKQSSSVAANIMPRLMKSIASRRRHTSSAGDPAYFFLPHCAARRARRTPGQPAAVMPAGFVPGRWPGPLTSWRDAVLSDADTPASFLR
jgi:hypothetical protein